jgi:hypothetical protein
MLRDKSYIVPAATFLLAGLILWARAPERITQGFLWAEDAAIFMAQASLPLHSAVSTDYAGYLHLLPRVIAWVQNRTGQISGAPHFFVWAALLITATSSAYISGALRVIPVWARIAMALAPVVSPQNGEVLLTITNLQWMLFPGLLVLLWECLFDPPKTGSVTRVAATVVLTLTGPFGVLVWPAAALIAWERRKSGIRLWWLAAYSAAVAVQAFVMIRYPAPHVDSGRVGWVARFFKELFSDLLPWYVPLSVGAILALLLVLAVALSRAGPVTGLLCLLGIAVWALGAQRVNGTSPTFVWYGAGSRYLYLPLLFFLWSSILAVATARFRLGAFAGVLMAAVVLIASATRFEVEVWRMWKIQSVTAGYEVTEAPKWSVFLPDDHKPTPPL